ncbi:phage tail protein [Pectinatus haikarae]|uniref:Microcystin-dependent protein n=1 Tax=Pectinatus haikarae TaxID=349096 RepID=A0ABT9Y962_9FIRM|nr:tail fiber protein [Pectinatus haikarae]MDQ0204061.1 microcystin-dependent protein [Pectinatus haikarae]
MIDFNIGMGPEQGISNLTALLATLNFWEPGAIPAVGDTVKSHSVTANCMLYAECTVSGTTGNSEPEWPAAGQTVVDGTVTWTIKDLRKPDIQTVPVGAGHEYYGDTAPAGYLLCNGSAVSRTTYVNLFALLGTKFGTGDGSTTFNLPDRRSRVGVGLNSADSDFATLGKNGGEKTHILTTAEMPSHGHTATTDAQGNHRHSLIYADNAGTASAQAKAGIGGSDWEETGCQYAGTHTHNVTIANNGSGAAHNNMPPYIVVNYIIKY